MNNSWHWNKKLSIREHNRTIAPVTLGWDKPQSLFHNRGSDHESEDPDTELEDLSEVSSMTGFGPQKDIDLTIAENLEGEDAYLTMKAAQHNFRRHTPKGDRKGFRRFTTKKKASSLTQKEKGKERVAEVERDFDAAFSITHSRIVVKVRATVAKLILLEKTENL